MRLLESWGPHFQLFMSSGRQGYRPADRLRWQSSGYLGPRLWLFGAARTQGKARINISGVLGSLPWPFKHVMATQDRTGRHLALSRCTMPCGPLCTVRML